MIRETNGAIELSLVLGAEVPTVHKKCRDEGVFILTSR